MGAAAALSALSGETAAEGTPDHESAFTAHDEQNDAVAETNTDEREVRIEDPTVTASAEIGPATMHSPPDCFDDLEINVWKDYYGIQIDIQADDNSDDRLTRFGMLLELNQDDVGNLIEVLEAFR